MMPMPTGGWHDIAMGAQRLEAWDGKRLVRCFAQRPASFISLLDNAQNKYPDKKALVFEQQRWTYQETWHEVLRCAKALAGLGIAQQDRVVLFVSNRPEFVFVLFAIQYLGAIAVPVGIREQKPGLTYIMNQCTAKAVVFDEALQDRIPGFSNVASLAHRIALDTPEHSGDVLSLSALCHASQNTPLELAITQEFDTAVILYTSGTTGNPKGAMLTHANITHSVLHYEYGMALTHEDTSALAVPASHVTGLIAIIAAMVHVAGAVIILREFKAASFLAAAVQEHMTHTLMVPAMYNLCLREPGFGGMALQHWRIGGYGGAPMPVSVIEQLAHHLPQLDLRNAYGATETTSPTTLMPQGANAEHADTVGMVLPCAQVVVMNDDGIEVPHGETGELWISGPMVTPGYWDNPQATEQSFTAGYWHSGDLGSIDAQGFVRIYDRKKDMLNRGGFKIYSVEVENCLMAMPGILEAAVVGRPCPVLGERVHAFVYAPTGATADAAVIAHCKAALADYKVPETITWLDAPLPRNANGKVLKRQLRLQETSA
jgi:O-succinylbenzoic acid--CoA ligase